MKNTLNLQDKIVLQNSTQRQLAILGNKGSGKTTICMMIMKELANQCPIAVFDPLNVVNNESIDATRIVLQKKDVDNPDIVKSMKAINALLKRNKTVVFGFKNLVQSEEVDIANIIIPLLKIKHGYVIFDEMHEFSPLHQGSTEVQRFVRHCRNDDVGIILTSQRAAAVNKNVLALSDAVLVMRTTWTHDLQAVKDLLSNVLNKEELKPVLKNLATLKFLEGYYIDYRNEELK